MEVILDWLKTHYKLVLVLLVVLLIIPTIFISMNKQKDRETSKYVLTKKLNRPDFHVTDTLVNKNDWKLVKIVSDRDTDKGNVAFAIFHEEEGESVLKVGPGTFFSQKIMTDAGVPDSIQQDVTKSLGQE